MQHNGWGDTLHLLRLLFYLVIVYSVLAVARTLHRYLQGRQSRQRQQKLSVVGGKASAPRQLPLLAFPRLELTVLLLSVPAIAGAGSGNSPQGTKMQIHKMSLLEI